MAAMGWDVLENFAAPHLVVDGAPVANALPR